MMNSTGNKINCQNKVILKLIFSVVLFIIGVRISYKIRGFAHGREDSEGWFLR